MEKNQIIYNIIKEYEYFHLEINDEIKNNILLPSLDFLNEKIKEYPEFDFDKILLIALILVNKLKKTQIRITPRILILTSTILWHSAILRPKDAGYYTQEDIDNKFERSISAARYLRQELGITYKKYDDLHDFYNKVVQSIPLREQMKVSYDKIPRRKYEFVRNLVTEKIIGREKAKSAIEATTFLFFNNNNEYSKNEIWYAISKNLDLQGLTPRASFNSDISRYTENATVKVKRKPLLFTITNIDEKEHRIQLIELIRNKINNLILKEDSGFFKDLEEIEGNINEYWECSKSSCDHKKIKIKRNQGVIKTNTWEEIITHFLQHYNRDSKYFGPSTIEEFLIDDLNKLLSETDKQEYEYEHSIEEYWRNRIRTALGSLKNQKGYIETDKSSDDDTYQAHYCSRRRTEKFFNDYKIYDDWPNITGDLKIKYALRDEKVNIFAMTKGIPSSKYTHQLILCKKSMMTRLGPFVLDPKTSQPAFELSDYGKSYQNQIWEEDYELKFIAYVDSQIKIKVSYDLFVGLEKEGFFVIWHPDAPFSYFKDKEEGYLVLFKIFTIDKIISEASLNKGRRGRNYYYSLEQPVFVKNVENIIPDNQFNVIKQNLINLLKQNDSLIKIIEKPGLSEKPFIWQMIKEASESLEKRRNGIFTISEIKDFILKNYGEVNEGVINSGIIAGTVNHDSRIHYNENKQPRIANSQYDFLYRIEKGKGDLELYDPEKHGIWEIKENEEGDLIVVQMKELQDKSLDSVYEGTELIKNIKEALLLKRQIILMGPPGTSKSYLAEQIAIQITKGKTDNIKMVQFHPSYSYEDFVECNIIEHGEIKPKEKIFRNFCTKASNEQKNRNNCVLIIDEINRGNVERIFGELIYGLEKRNKKIPTVYFEDELTIPDNLFVIGTMNTVDLSIANIDAALRRRFYVIEIEPNINLLKNWLKYHLDDKYSVFQNELVKFMEKLNKNIENHELMGKYRTIGHAIFMLKAISEKLELDEIRKNLEMEWKYMIRPTILEYLHFPDDEELKQYDTIFEEFSNKAYNI